MVKVCFVLLLEQGHLMICSSIGKYLLTRDPKNEVLFITDEEFAPVIKRQCSKFQTILFKQPEGSQERHKAKMKNKLDMWKMKDKESYASMVKNFISMQELWQSRQHIVKDLVESIENLDFLFIENLFNLPFLQNNNKIKWGMVISTNPLRIADQINYPPMNSGVCEPQESKEYLELFRQNGTDFLNSLDEWYKTFGLIRKPSLCYVEGSDYLNVFLFPKPLNYFEPKDIPGKWIQLNSTIIKGEVDKFVRSQNWVDDQAIGKELLTPEFLAKPGKLILFSLGTVVTRTVTVFQEQLKLLENIPHKFIVSKGKFADQFELPSNCVGAANLNQLELLPLVDLFVTHAGNNSFTEAFYFGTPMVCIPCFGDQRDNACRLEQMNLGKRLHIGHLTKENLESAINQVANNEEIRRRMTEISQQIRNDKDGIDEVCDLVYELCSK